MLHKKISFYELEKKLKKIKKISQLKKFYFKFYKNYIKLNKTYLFSSSSNLKYIYNQIDLNKDRIKDKKSLNLIPFGIKDIINTKDLPTDFGIKSRKKFGSGNNARIVDKILGEGGIIFCKTNCAEFAVHYIDKNKQKNPLNQKYSAGTSSTGSAISIACGALPISIGTQTAGSNNYYGNSSYGIAFNVNDNLSISYAQARHVATKTKKRGRDANDHQSLEKQEYTPKSWMRGDSLQVAYTIGGVGLKYAKTDYDNTAYGFDTKTARESQLVQVSLAF